MRIGIITLKAGENKIELQDLTGFDGRCDAVFLALPDLLQFGHIQLFAAGLEGLFFAA